MIKNVFFFIIIHFVQGQYQLHQTHLNGNKLESEILYIYINFEDPEKKFLFEQQDCFV